MVSDDVKRGRRAKPQANLWERVGTRRVQGVSPSYFRSVKVFNYCPTAQMLLFNNKNFLYLLGMTFKRPPSWEGKNNRRSVTSGYIS